MFVNQPMVPNFVLFFEIIGSCVLFFLGMLKDDVIGEQLIADYLLFMMNRNGNFE